jgi:hypothetical protein
MPSCIADVLVDNPLYPAGVCRAVKTFRSSKPFRGSINERQIKFAEFVDAMNTALDMNVGIVFHQPECQNSFNSGVDCRGDRPVIVIVGKLSIATLFYCYAGCMAEDDPQMADHWGRMKWAANLFKRFFPRSFSGIDTSGTFLVRNA